MRRPKKDSRGYNHRHLWPLHQVQNSGPMRSLRRSVWAGWGKSTASPTEVRTNKDVVSMLNAGLTQEIVSTPALSYTLRDEFLYIDPCQLDASALRGIG
jgi:hypothetical protein